MNTRDITVFSVQTSTAKVYNTNARTWGELKDIISEDYSLNNVEVAENITYTTLSSDMAVLPEGAFVLHIKPVQTKAGSDEYAIPNRDVSNLKEMYNKLNKIQKHLNTLYSLINEEIDVNQTGSNLTQDKLNDLREESKRIFG